MKQIIDSFNNGVFITYILYFEASHPVAIVPVQCVFIKF